MKNTMQALLALAAALPAQAQGPGAARAEFARRERHWLHVTRWREQQRCVDAHAAAPPPAEQAEMAAHCLAEITLRRLETLPPATLAAAR